MSRSEKVEVVLGKADGLEKKYDWIKAAELYERALGLVGKRDFSRAGDIQERIAYCFYRAAFQAETQEEFKRRMGLSVEGYEETAGIFEGLEDPKKQARAKCCRGMASYRKSWLAESSSERKALLDKCWKLEKAALKVYEAIGDRLAYGKAGNELLTCLIDRDWLTWDWQERKNILEEAMEYGEKAIAALSEVRDEYELARAYYMLSYHYWFGLDTYESIEKQKEISQKCFTYAQKALDISQKVEDLYLNAMSNWVIGFIFSEVSGDLDSSLKSAEKALEMSTKINDKFMIAMGCSLLASVVWWKTDMEEDPDKRRKGYNKVIQYAEDVITHYQLFSNPYFEPVYMAHIESYSFLAIDETNLEEKLVLLRKAAEVGRKDLEQADRSGSPYPMISVFHSLSKALYFLSTGEMKTGEKRRLLEEASKYREENIRMNERVNPFFFWNRGVAYNYSALIKAELAKIETNNQKKTDLLRKAITSMEDCLKLCRRAVEARPRTKLFASIGSYQDWFGGILNQLYLLTGEKRHLERAIRVYEDTVNVWEKADQHSRTAEAHWKMARLYDLLGEHSQAALEFESAAEKYTLAAEKIPRLNEFYMNYGLYMQAWSEIEKAKYHHAEKQYGQAKEHYEKAANLHKSTNQWNYLSQNYFAWTRLEEAEDLSRREQTKEAKEIFQQAAKLFGEAKKSIQAKLVEIESKDEKELLVNLAKASDIRREYCLGRMALEEAKILDRKGDHAASSRKYASAAQKFQEATEAMEQEWDRQELRPIAALCRAWQMMTSAEVEASPDRYLEASKLFEEAKEHSLDEDAKVLALGHSCFCKALEAGTRFEATREPEMHSTAKRYLEAAANYYLKAGFKNAAEYAEATNTLFDAYMYMHKAEMETAPRKKAQYYQMAERLLQASGGSYMKAKHPEKGEQVQRLLEGVREKRQLAISLTKVLHAPTATSTTASFSTPTPTHEEAVGLERFEHADVQATLLLRVKEANVGEDVGFRMELVNAGKAPALLIKVDEITPESFEIRAVPEICAVEDNYLDLKGRRLNPLKTVDIKLTVKPQSKGTFSIKPRVLYIDETGKYRSHEPEPVTITVKELGIRGWIKGER